MYAVKPTPATNASEYAEVAVKMGGAVDMIVGCECSNLRRRSRGGTWGKASHGHMHDASQRALLSAELLASAHHLPDTQSFQLQA